MEKTEAYQRLSELKSRGIDIVKYSVLVATSPQVPESVVEFIKNNSLTESDKFFENLRSLHNKRGHKLYPSILNEDLDEIGKLKCLSSYLTSACIAMESMSNAENALELRRSIGLEVVSKALYEYYNGINYDSINDALKYLRNLIK